MIVFMAEKTKPDFCVFFVFLTKVKKSDFLGDSITK
jgi:hypothetical protein